MGSTIMRLHARQVRRIICMLFMFFHGWIYAQQSQTTISGNVKDTAGNPIQEAIVSLRGSNASNTTTDNNGTFQLTASLGNKEYTVSIFRIGYKTKTITVTPDASTGITVLMEPDNSSLNEVVVTGTSSGTTRRQLGSYVSTVKADDMNKGSTGNVLAALQGKTAGAQISQNSGDPAGGISVKLRGINTISGSTDPLYIIDGVILDNSTTRVTNADPNYAGGSFVGSVGQNRMVDINPDDIERVEVLNGAAAAAIYGSRANAGVVQIFTKRGSKGAPVVSFSSVNTLSSLRKQLAVNEASVKFGGDPSESTQTILTPTITNTTPVTRYNYQDYIFRTGTGTDNTVSVSGGQDKTKYYTSASYMYNQGIIKNTDFSRLAFRLNLDQVLTSWASFNASINYIYDKTHEKPDGNTFFSPMNAVTIIGNYYDIEQRDALGNLQAIGERGRVNPVSIIEDFKQQQQTSRAIVGAGLKLTPIKNLTIDYHFGLDNYSQDGTTFIPPYAYNVSTAFYGGGPTLDPTQNGYASSGTNISLLLNHDLNATYKANISNNISSVTQLGYSLQYQKAHYSLQQGRGLPPFVQTVSGATTAMIGADNRTEMTISGEFIQENLSYKNQLYITGAVRVDGSSVFGDDQRNQVYKKLSGSYILSSTDFWNTLGVSSWWNLLKIRAAYGESGNLTGIPAYGRFNTYTAAAFLGSASFQSQSQYTNPDVKPERQRELEFGADLAFIDNRLGLTVNYYRKKVSDLLISRAIAPTNGFTSRLDNIGSLQNNGIEIVLNATPVKTKDFGWDMTAIYNSNRNKALNIGQNLILYSTNSGAPVSIINGQPIGVFYGTFFARDNNGNILLNNAGIPQMELGTQNDILSYTPQKDATTGMPTGTALQKIIGNPNPKYTATWTNDFSYKNLGLHIQLDAVQGVDVFNADFRTRQGVDNGTVAQQEDEGLLPRGYIVGAYQVQEWRIDDGSFVKLREVALSYKIGKALGFQDLTFSFGGRNLISWDKYRGYDPEVNAAGQSAVLRGIDFGTVPIPKTFSFSIRAKF